MFDDSRLLGAAGLPLGGTGKLMLHSLEPNMRRLRALVEVAQCNSVNRAADRLHVTQSAVTRTVRALEKEVGLTLFERSSRGMATTAYGEILVTRVRRALDYLDTAERELTAVKVGANSERVLRNFASKVAQRHLLTLSAIADFQTETAAAQHLGVSQPSVTLALRDLEEMVRMSLFLRTPNGMIPTAGGNILIRGAKLALNEISAVTADLAAQQGMVRGRLVVGALPLSGTQIAPLAVSRVISQHPHLRLSVVEAHYDMLLKGLRCGDIDVIVGALHPNPPGDTMQERMFDDVLSVVARHGHPLSKHKSMALPDLQSAEWVVPYRRTGTRNVVEMAMLAAGLTLPTNAVEASSVVMVRTLLLESDRLSVLSRRQIYYEERAGLLTVLPIDLPGTKLSVGFLTRSDAIRTVGLESLLAQLRTLGPTPVASIAHE